MYGLDLGRKRLSHKNRLFKVLEGDFYVPSRYLIKSAGNTITNGGRAHIHIEADIKALAGNPNGFEEGAWIPYLLVKFEVTKVGTNQKVQGDFMPMVANDGPHYGDNIKLFGPGKYHVKYTILPPSENKHAHFGRHTDRQTGVRPWFKPFDVEYDFSYVGIGKKGGY
ncbi:MAG: hypothetical protein RL081_1536 [Pseudomonadota bacterium]